VVWYSEFTFGLVGRTSHYKRGFKMIWFFSFVVPLVTWAFLRDKPVRSFLVWAAAFGVASYGYIGAGLTFYDAWVSFLWMLFGGIFFLTELGLYGIGGWIIGFWLGKKWTSID
jgi:hypothetical protein